MKKLFTIILLFAINGLSTQQANAQPTITSFTPASGPIGTTVTITGTNFNTTLANNIVFFGATKATVSAGSATSLTVTVPTGASYQPISVTNLTTGLTAYSAQPFITTFACGGVIDASSFATKVDFTTGNYPHGVSTGDFDGDGKTDLAVVNEGSSTVSVFRNTGSSGTISFAAKVDFATGTDPRSVSTGDLDGDGKLDLAVANWTSNTVSIFRNTGSSGTISFAANVDYATGAQPFSVSTGDFDGDGKLDLTVPNYNSNTVSVFRNTGSIGTISFAANVDFATGANPCIVSTGDLDGDGKTDLAVANVSSNTVSVFRNTSASGGGTISFAAKVDFTTGLQPFSVSTGDLDGDGKPDLAVANWSSSNVSVFRNTGSSGTISFAAKVDFTAGGQTHSVSIADLDGDGKTDLAVANYGSITLAVLRNTGSSGTISFAAKVDFTTVGASRIVSTGDLDGDGKTDLAVVNYNSNTVSVFRNLIAGVPPTVTLVINPDTVCINTGAYTLTGGSPNGGTYSGAGVSGGNFNPNTAGSGLHTITYSYTDGNSCSDSTTAQIFVDVCTGIQMLLSNQTVLIFPNPFSTQTTLHTDNSLHNATLTVYNSFGQTVKQITPITIGAGQTVTLFRDNLPSGLYFIRVTKDNKVITADKLVITD